MDSEAAFEVEYSSIFSVDECVSFKCLVQEAMEDDDGINYPPNLDTPKRDTREPVEEAVAALPATDTAQKKRKRKNKQYSVSKAASLR